MAPKESSKLETYGGVILKLLSGVYFVPGSVFPLEDKVNSTTIHKYNIANNDWDDNNNMFQEHRIYMPSFVINIPFKGTVGYFGAGENPADKSLASFNFWSFDGTETPTQVASCGVEGFAKGISFAIADKGYIGFGRTKEKEVTNEFWVYIPKIDQNSINKSSCQ